jgi:AcrR family transcriptional regulator
MALTTEQEQAVLSAHPEASTRDRVRQEAARLFARRGYGGTSMSEIADRVGVRKASLYSHFDSKADLMLELVEDSLERWQEACRGDQRPGQTVEQRLVTYLGAAVRFGKTHPEAVGILRLAAGQMPSELRQRFNSLLDRHDQEWRDTLTQLFREAKERGEVEGGDAHELGLFWSVFVHGLLINQIFETHKSEAMLENLQPMWRLFWRGVSGRFPTTEIEV